MNDQVADSKQYDTVASRAGIDVRVLIGAILAAQFVTGDHVRDRLTWLHLPAIASIVWALGLHLGAQRTGLSSPTASALIRGYMLIVLALSALVVGARLGFPQVSFAEAWNNRMHGALRERVVWLLSCILIPIAVMFPILSRTARLSPVWWLSVALILILVSSMGIVPPYR